MIRQYFYEFPATNRETSFLDQSPDKHSTKNNQSIKTGQQGL